MRPQLARPAITADLCCAVESTGALAGLPLSSKNGSAVRCRRQSQPPLADRPTTRRSRMAQGVLCTRVVSRSAGQPARRQPAVRIVFGGTMDYGRAFSHKFVRAEQAIDELHEMTSMQKGSWIFRRHVDSRRDLFKAPQFEKVYGDQKIGSDVHAWNRQGVLTEDAR